MPVGFGACVCGFAYPSLDLFGNVVSSQVLPVRRRDVIQSRSYGMAPRYHGPHYLNNDGCAISDQLIPLPLPPPTTHTHIQGRQGSLCYFNLDHIFPWSRGGRSTCGKGPALKCNLVAMSSISNTAKSNHLFNAIIRVKRPAGQYGSEEGSTAGDLLLVYKVPT